jgi:hypothetical protein
MSIQNEIIILFHKCTLLNIYFLSFKYRIYINNKKNHTMDYVECSFSDIKKVKLQLFKLFFI